MKAALIIQRALSAAWLVIRAGFDGAKWSPLRSNRRSGLQDARLDINKTVRTILVDKSREFERNSFIQNRLADLFECYTSGRGLPVSFVSGDADWNARVARSYRQWCKMCDLTGRQSFETLHGLWARSWFIDGEVFIRLTYSRDTNRPRLDTIEAHRVQTPPELADQEGKSIIDGVGIDSEGRVTGYYVLSDDPEKRGQIKFRFVPRDFIVHLFEPSRPGQYRGLPFCHSVINMLHDLDDMHLLELQAAKRNAARNRFIKTAIGEFSAEALQRSGGETTSVDGKRRFDYYQEVAGAAEFALHPEDDIIDRPNQLPSAATQWLWRDMREAICLGQGIPYVVAFPDSMQGTVYRGALDMANAYFRARFGVLATVVERIVLWWSAWAKKFEPDLRGAPEDWDAIAISPPRAINVDVGRNSQAMLSELSAGIRSHVGVIAEDGGNWQQILIQKAQVKKFALELVKLPEFEGVTVEDLIASGLPAPAQASLEMDEETIPDPR